MQSEYKDKSEREQIDSLEQDWNDCYNEIVQTWEDYGYIMSDVNLYFFYGLSQVDDRVVKQLKFDSHKMYVCAFYYLHWLLWDEVEIERDVLLSVWRKTELLLGENDWYSLVVRQLFEVLLGELEWSDDLLCSEKMTEMSNWIADTYGYNYTPEDWM